MSAAGRVRYAKNGDVQLAYRISDGGGPPLVSLSGGVPEVLAREHPMTLDYYRRLEGFSRLLVIDPQGSGRSDPLPPSGLTTEMTVANLLAVLDDAGLERVHVFGFHSGGVTALALAALHPERVDRLILANAWARILISDDQPWGIAPEFSEWLIDQHRDHIGQGEMFAEAFVPSRRGDPHVAGWFADLEGGIARAQAVAITRWSQDADVRELLPMIDRPTLVLHTDRNRPIAVEHGRYLASRIRGAKLVELPGIDHAFPVTDLRDPFLDEIEAFVTGARPRPRGERAFAAVLFTDIVGSTERAAEMGDGSWRLVLADHDRTTRAAIEHHGGELVKSTGDGVLALFDAPSRAVGAAQQVVNELERSATPVRAGIHAGEVERRDDDVAGIAVHLAQRVCSQADAGEIWVSRGFPDLVLGAGFSFDDRGAHVLKGIDGPVQLWSVA